MTVLTECSCARCGATFSRRPSRLKYKPMAATYCSVACSRAGVGEKNKRGHWLATFTENLWIPEPNSGCWLWLGAVNRLGYGLVTRRSASKAIFAHRAAYIAAHGSIPQGMDILHRCDTPLCVNPDHLFSGTHTDNMRDMIRKGRHVALRGEAHWAARITAGDALAIRASNKPHATLAARYGISKHTVHTIRSNRSWTHLAQTAIALTPPGPGDAP
jgi:hypothetical protein